MFCPGVKSCQSDGREDWSKQSSLWRSIIPSRLHLPGFNSMNVCYEMGILKSFLEVCGGVTWDMGSWWEVSVWGLCWHQVNVGVKAPWQGPESGPKPLEWRLQYLWRARHSEHATTLREPWRALVTMSHSESPGPMSPPPLDTPALSPPAWCVMTRKLIYSVSRQSPITPHSAVTGMTANIHNCWSNVATGHV